MSSDDEDTSKGKFTPGIQVKGKKPHDDTASNSDENDSDGKKVTYIISYIF